MLKGGVYQGNKHWRLEKLVAEIQLISAGVGWT